MNIERLQTLKLKTASFGFHHIDCLDAVYRRDNFGRQPVNPAKQLLSGLSSTTLEFLTLFCSCCADSETVKGLARENYSVSAENRPLGVLHSIIDLIPDGIQFPSLRSLTIRSGIYIPDNYFTDRSEYFPSLTTLVIEKCHAVPIEIETRPRRILGVPSTSPQIPPFKKLENLYLDFLDPNEGILSWPVSFLTSLVIHFNIPEMGLFERVCSFLDEAHSSLRLTSFSLSLLSFRRP